jgi:hypothetical protein
MVDGVSALGQPERIAAGAAPDVGDHRGRRWQVVEQDLGRPLELDDSARRVQAATLVSVAVVLEEIVGAAGHAKASLRRPRHVGGVHPDHQ